MLNPVERLKRKSRFMSMNKKHSVSQDRKSFIKKSDYFRSLNHNKMVTFREKTSRMKSSFSQIGQKCIREISEEMVRSKRKNVIHLSHNSILVTNRTINDRNLQHQTLRYKKEKMARAKNKMAKNMLYLPNLKKLLKQRRESDGKVIKANKEQKQLYMNNTVDLELEPGVSEYFQVNFKRDYHTKVIFSKVSRYKQFR